MISMEVTGMAEVKKHLQELQQRARNPETAMEICAVKAWRDVIHHFNNTEGPDGKWKSLRPATILNREHGGSKPLNDSGLLRMSNRYRVLKSEAHVYNKVKYAATHNYGDTRLAWGKIMVTIPKREFMWLSNKAKLAIIKTIKRYIVMGTAEFGS